VLRQQQRQAAHFAAFGVQMVLGEGHRPEGEILGELRQLDAFAEHLLEAIGTGCARPQLLALVQRAGNRGIEEKHELHRGASKNCTRARRALVEGKSLRVCRSRRNDGLCKFLDIW